MYLLDPHGLDVLCSLLTVEILFASFISAEVRPVVLETRPGEVQCVVQHVGGDYIHPAVSRDAEVRVGAEKMSTSSFV